MATKYKTTAGGVVREYIRIMMNPKCREEIKKLISVTEKHEDEDEEEDWDN
jgi:hypothetical protein